MSTMTNFLIILIILGIIGIAISVWIHFDKNLKDKKIR